MKETNWNKLRGDGGTQPCSAERLVQIKEEFKQMSIDAGASANDRRAVADDIRFCRWPGQSPDGKKHAAAQGGKPAFPFEGASDRRERTADGITNEQVIIIMAGLMRLNLGFLGVPGPDGQKNSKTADAMGILWEWVKRNQLGAEWILEWTKFGQWRQGDSPGLAFMQVSWHQESAIKKITTSAQEVTSKALELAQAQQMQVQPADQADLADLLVNPERIDELVQLLQQIWQDLRDDSAKTLAGDLLDAGEATFPYPYICENRLKIKARRLFEDIYVPENTPMDLKRARIIYVREWFTESELMERDAKGDFLPGFVKEVLDHEGESGWVHWSRYDSETGSVTEDAVERPWNKERQRGMYEILTAFYRGFNSHGIPGIYSVEYHANVDTAGTEQQLIDYPINGHYPFVASSREVLTHNLWDSRGNSELSATEQNALKLLHDSFMDNVQLSTVPPIEVPASRPKVALMWGPLKEIRVNRAGEVKPFAPFPYPAGNDKMDERVRRGIARYFGQFSESNPPDLVRAYNQSLVDFMLIPVVQVMWMGLKLSLKFLPAEQLAQIIGPELAPVEGEQRPEDAEFRVEASFDAGMLSLEYITAVGKLFTEVIFPSDTDQTVPRAEWVKWFVGMITPMMANKLVRPKEDADQSEIEDEERNFTKIAAGIEPPMEEEGQNWELRRQVLLDIGEKNPQAFQALTPNSKLILEARLKHFDGMLQQEQNAQIGRTMAAPALQAGGPAAAA